MKKLIAIIYLLCGSYATYAQNIKAEDMLKFSQHYPWGSARAMGMSGAFGALGGDISSLSLNPAGIGVYRTSDFSLTLSMNSNKSSSNLKGNKSDEFSDKFNIGSIGYVYTYNTQKNEGWISASFGVAYNRLNDFNKNIVMKNPKATSSLLDDFSYYANNANQYPADLSNLTTDNSAYFYEGLAFNYFVLDTVNDSPWYSSDFANDHKYGQYQERKRNISGGIDEYAFTFGANYSNRLYIGATIGLQQIDYEETSTHTEIDKDGTIADLSSFSFTEHIKQHGSGYNFKIGLQYKPFNFVRLGLALHSPTFYNIDSEFYTAIDATFDRPIRYLRNIDRGSLYPLDNYAYGSTDSRLNTNRLRSPWKMIGSAAILFNQYGLISIDYERLNYQNMHLSGDINYNNDPNDQLKDTYRSVDNIRIGAEGKIGDLALRAGWGYYGSPFKSSDLKNNDYTTYSTGLGYRGKSFYVDLAYMLLKYSERYMLYEYTEVIENNKLIYKNNNPTIANIDHNINRFLLTIGFRF